MNETWLVLVAAVVLIVVAAGLWLLLSRRRSSTLRQQFGPEYEHAVHLHGDRRTAEEDLETRREQVSELELRDLTPEERSELITRWERVQTRFVDEPTEAVVEADTLLSEAMRDRGYPLDHIRDGDRREQDLSVAYPAEVSSFREATAIAARSRRGDATTEELRRAMVCYRSLFEGLVGAELHPARHAEEIHHADRRTS
jgi:hypothetical protein